MIQNSEVQTMFKDSTVFTIYIHYIFFSYDWWQILYTLKNPNSFMIVYQSYPD